MEERNASVECFLISIPCCYLQQREHFEDLINNDESIIYGLSANTLLINEKTAARLKLITQNSCKVVWVVLKINLKFDESSNVFETKRLTHVIIDERVGDELVVLSEDFRYNIEYSSGLRYSSSISSRSKPEKLSLSSESRCERLPAKATKVILSLVHCNTNLQDNFVDQVLQVYFSSPRYLCKNDVFGVHMYDHDKLNSLQTYNIDVLYFKVCEIECIQTHDLEIPNDVCQGYFVDSSVSIYQVTNSRDLCPRRTLTHYYDLGLTELLNDEQLILSLNSRGHNLMPVCFDDAFKVLCGWMEPFLCGYKKLKDVQLNPLFLISGPNGSGKTMLLEALARYFGINYWRIDCVMVGEPIPGQAEAKLKVLFSKLNTTAPCILQLSNIQALFEDADGKDDVRVLTCFNQQIKSLKPKWPVVIMATTSNLKSMSSNINQLFLESINLSPFNQAEREEVLSWFINLSRGIIDKQILQAVAAQTSGFLLRDLEMLVSLALKEMHNRIKTENVAIKDLVYSDFSKIIGIMRKVFSESIGAPKVPSVSWKDVGGLEHLKKEILSSLRSNMFNTGLKRSGLLLHGPPGTGKTLLAKAVATQCGRNFLSVKGPELLNMYVGQSEHNVRDLFQLAKAASPCIVFFDELDSLAPNRGRSGDSGGVMDRVVSQLLAEMDGLSDSGDVFILGATNRPDLIDPALLRPGRLDKLLFVGQCEDKASQLSVLTALTRKLTLATDVDLEELVSRLPSQVSGAQLSSLCSSAWLSSARQIIHSGEYIQNSTVAVGQRHFLDALSTSLS